MHSESPGDPVGNAGGGSRPPQIRHFASAFGDTDGYGCDHGDHPWKRSNVKTLTYVRTYVRTYARTYVRTYIRTCVRTYAYVHTYLRTFICTYVHTYARMYVCYGMYVRMYIRIHVCTYGRTDVHTVTDVHACVRSEPPGISMTLCGICHRRKYACLS
jgi:hypothetical protein